MPEMDLISSDCGELEEVSLEHTFSDGEIIAFIKGVTWSL